jgi:N-acetyl-anhydromuramyl-L-alanine amidase AmpD
LSRNVIGAVVLAIVTCLTLLWIGPKPIGTGSSQAEASSIGDPPQAVAWAYPTNYGERVRQDLSGAIVRNPFIVVLHETVGSADSAISLFQTANYTKNGHQVSYHTLIRLDGTIVYTVPFKYRAFGAADSVFMGKNGPESVQTNLQVPASVNNFAYHFSLETPPDGRNNADSHSGYTALQYRSLAWLVKYTKVSKDRITGSSGVMVIKETNQRSKLIT